MAQSKMNHEEKQEVRDLIANFESDGVMLFYFPDIGLTLAIEREFPKARNAKVGISWQADTETKFRKLVGADKALRRLAFASFPVPVEEGYERDFAEAFADMFRVEEKNFFPVKRLGSRGPKPA